MNNFRLIKTTVFLMLGILSCTHDPILVEPDSMGTYYLISQISPDISPNGAVVGYALPETISEDVSGAVVTLSGNGQSVVLDELQPGVYADEQEQVDIVPGQRYDISARINKDVLLYAYTYLPGEFRLLKEDMPDTLEYIVQGFIDGGGTYFFPTIYDPPQIKWTKSKYAFSYSVHINYNGIASYDTVSSLPGVSSLKGINDPNQIMWTEKYLLTIIAKDSTFLPFSNPYDTGLNTKNPEIDDKIKKGMHAGYNDNILGNGFGRFSSQYAITDSIIIRFKKEILTFE